MLTTQPGYVKATLLQLSSYADAEKNSLLEMHQNWKMDSMPGQQTTVTVDDSQEAPARGATYAF